MTATLSATSATAAVIALAIGNTSANAEAPARLADWRRKSTKTSAEAAKHKRRRKLAKASKRRNRP